MKRIKNAALFICALSVAFANGVTQAVTLSTESFAQIQAKYEGLNIGVFIDYPASFVDENSSTPEERIYLESMVINRLALFKEPTLEQKEWINEQRSSQQSLSIPSSEHVNQLIMIANVANSANMVHMHWQAYEMQKEMQQRWESGSWSWEVYFRDQSFVSKMAMTFWVEDMPDPNALLLGESYIQLGLSYDVNDNRQLSLLINKTQLPKLYSVLWQRQSNIYSHHVLKNIIDEGENVRQIINATQNPALSSQALFSLVKDHSNETEVQSFIRKAIENEQLSSAVVATLSLLSDDGFKNQLINHYRQQPSTSLTRQVMKKLRGNHK